MWRAVIRNGALPSLTSAAARSGTPEGINDAMKNNPNKVERLENPRLCRCLESIANSTTVENPMEIVPPHSRSPPTVMLRRFDIFMREIAPLWLP